MQGHRSVRTRGSGPSVVDSAEACFAAGPQRPRLQLAPDALPCYRGGREHKRPVSGPPSPHAEAWGSAGPRAPRRPPHPPGMLPPVSRALQRTASDVLVEPSRPLWSPPWTGGQSVGNAAASRVLRREPALTSARKGSCSIWRGLQGSKCLRRSVCGGASCTVSLVHPHDLVPTLCVGMPSGGALRPRFTTR
jgi:hypothetical protein